MARAQLHNIPNEQKLKVEGWWADVCVLERCFEHGEHTRVWGKNKAFFRQYVNMPICGCVFAIATHGERKV